jgi:hypothetical protein
VLTRYFLKASPGVRSIAAVFPDEVAALCRSALQSDMKWKGYFQYFNRSASLKYAMEYLGRRGTSEDPALLRAHVGDRDVGTYAIDAIRAIEQRIAAS